VGNAGVLRDQGVPKSTEKAKELQKELKDPARMEYDRLQRKASQNTHQKGKIF